MLCFDRNRRFMQALWSRIVEIIDEIVRINTDNIGNLLDGELFVSFLALRPDGNNVPTLVALWT